MSHLSEPTPNAPAAGQATPTAADRAQAARLLAALDELTTQQPTAVRIDDPAIPSHRDGPRIGDTPPVPQPGIPPMSATAVDTSVKMIAGGFLSLCLGGAVSLVLYTSGKADPTVVGLMAAAPPAAFLSLKALIKGVKRAAMPEIHNHIHNGPAYHENHIDQRRSITSKTINKH